MKIIYDMIIPIHTLWKVQDFVYYVALQNLSPISKRVKDDMFQYIKTEIYKQKKKIEDVNQKHVCDNRKSIFVKHGHRRV